MLMSKSMIENGDIASFKLVNGDEIVAKVIEVSADRFVIDRPCVIVPNQQGIGVMQAMFTANVSKSIELLRQHAMMIAITEDRMRDHYLQMTTGIQPVSKGSIVV